MSVAPSSSSVTPDGVTTRAAGGVAPDPESYRMTLGEHLEDLRRRLIYGALGLLIATVICLAFGETVVAFLCEPLLAGMREAGMNPQPLTVQVTGTFMLYLKVSVIAALAVSGPWILYQLWQFVAAGLYPNERRTVTRHIPMSIVLFISGLALAYFVAMPLTVKFLLHFNATLSPLGFVGSPKVDITPEQVVKVPMLQGDPTTGAEGQIWFNAVDGRLKFFLGGAPKVIDFGPDSMIASRPTIEDYVDLTLMTLLVFGFAFQLPLVVLALFKVGIIELTLLRSSRRVVYFALSIVAAVVAPGDVLSAMFALYIPLIALYEFGILLCVWSERKSAKEMAADA